MTRAMLYSGLRSTPQPGFPSSNLTKRKWSASSPPRGWAIREGDTIKKFFNRPLAEGGVNIEGIAVKNDRMYFGLRGPSLDGSAFVLSVDAEAVFTKEGDLKSKVTPLALGLNTGIRDLAAINDGILILAGPTRDETVPYAVWFWDGVGTTAKPLGTLDLGKVDKGAKAEICSLSREIAQISACW
jgi:Protein of unknown function (DUF3616)